MDARDKCSSSVDVKMQFADIIDEYCVPLAEVWVPQDSAPSLSSCSLSFATPLLFALLVAADDSGAEFWSPLKW